jgi:hypothetical protein
LVEVFLIGVTARDENTGNRRFRILDRVLESLLKSEGLLECGFVISPRRRDWETGRQGDKETRQNNRNVYQGKAVHTCSPLKE